VTNPLTMKSWSPNVVGIGIGVPSWFAFATADHPLGVSTAFEHTAALAEKTLVPQAEQTNEYFAKKAQEGKPPKIGWEWMVVLGVFIGALLSSRLSGDGSTESVPAMWRERFGGNVPPRLGPPSWSGPWASTTWWRPVTPTCTSSRSCSGACWRAASVSASAWRRAAKPDAIDRPRMRRPTRSDPRRREAGPAPPIRVFPPPSATRLRRVPRCARRESGRRDPRDRNRPADSSRAWRRCGSGRGRPKCDASKWLSDANDRRRVSRA